jgi:hypothetical protein
MPIGNLRIATDESYVDRDGNKVEKAEWHSVVVFQRVAENCANYLTTGSLVYVEGSLQTRKWQDQQGQDRYTTEVKAMRVKFLILVVGINKFILDIYNKYLTEALTSSDPLAVSTAGPIAVTAIISCFILAQVLGIASALGGGVALSTMGAGRWVASKVTRPTKQVAGAATNAAAGATASGAKLVARSALAGYRKRGSVAKG